MSAAADLFKRAIEHHQAGQLQQAEQLYRQVLEADPGHADANHLWGVLAYQAGRADLAVKSIMQAIALNPSAAVFHSNLGLAQDMLGETEAAIGSYRRALMLSSDFADAHNHLAYALHKLGHVEQAIAHARSAIQIRPDFAEAHNNLARALYDKGLISESESHLRMALESKPNYAEAHNNLGVILADRNEAGEATAHYREALRLNPNYREAHNNLGNILGHQGRFVEAVQSFGEALRIDGGFAAAHGNRGTALLMLGEVDEAIASYRHALNLQPNNAEMLSNLGGALVFQGSVSEAVQCFRRALQLQPGLTSAQSNLLLIMNYEPQADPDFTFTDHRRWGDALCRQSAECGVRSVESKTSERRTLDSDSALRTPDTALSEKRLRIGYVSPDLREHALIRYFEPVLAHHDPARVETFCYSEASYADSATERLRNLAHNWRSIRGLTNVQAAQVIQDDHIDILVDLAGHTAGNRLDVFALKPAPLQATWLGYLNTTGLSTIDYRLTDEILDPPGQPVRDTEELFRLPGGFCCFQPWPNAPEVGPLPARRRGHLTFGSLHTLCKLNSDVYDLWCRVLQAVPGSRLFMLRDTLKGEALERTRREFAQRGIGQERLDLRSGVGPAGGLPRGGHLDVYADIDVSLDAFPWTGGVTTCESLWMGAPMLSVAGVRPAARNSASILAQVGLSDWICTTADEFVARAAQLPTQLDQLESFRAELRKRMTATICDAARFTRTLEDAYRAMWQKKCGVRGPESGV